MVTEIHKKKKNRN